MATETDEHDFTEAVNGEVTCDGCGKTIDMSDADTVAEVEERWNEHVREDHPGRVSGEITPDSMYFMGLYDGLFRFSDIGGEVEMNERSGEILASKERAESGEWTIPGAGE